MLLPARSSSPLPASILLLPAPPSSSSLPIRGNSNMQTAYQTAPFLPSSSATQPAGISDTSSSPAHPQTPPSPTPPSSLLLASSSSAMSSKTVLTPALRPSPRAGR